MSERRRNHRLELHRLTGNGMIEAEHIGMKTKAMYRVVAIAVFYVATYRMSHIGRVYTNLVFPTCLQFVFHKTMLRSAVEHPVMGDGIFSAIVHR